MTLERVALGVLTAIALLMGVNYVSATSRFLDANRAYDSLSLTLEEFSFTSVEEPVDLAIGVRNPSPASIEILALHITLRAGVQSVGGGEIHIEEILAPGDVTLYRVPVLILDRNVVERQLERDGAVRWLVRGEIQVRVDRDLEPVWIQFSVRLEES